MKNLMSMTDFVLKIYNRVSDDSDVSCLIKIFDYANFLKQLLALWMFVPCKLVDGVWVVLEQPNILDHRYSGVDVNDFETDLKEYQQAKERCLFEGFEFIEALKIINCNLNEFKTIEDLVKYKLLLTATAQKQIGL